MKDVSLTDARNNLLRLAEDLQRNPSKVVEVVKRGKPVLALMSAELYEALVETLEILGEESALKKLRQALREIEEGRGISWGAAKKRLGLGT